MPDLLQQGSDWLADRMKTHAGRIVTFRRGNDTVAVTATIGRTEFEIDDEFGVLRKIESRDFLIPAADLVLNLVTVLPERGDEIDETQGTVTYTYEVMAPGREPHFRYSDPYRKTLRIHTKQTDSS
ncbi:MAG: hypothetical protein ACE5KM_14660 [Planctomycetaceae bacterium]